MSIGQFHFWLEPVKMGVVRADNYGMLHPCLFRQHQDANGGFHFGVVKLRVSGVFRREAVVHTGSEDKSINATQEGEQFLAITRV